MIDLNCFLCGILFKQFVFMYPISYLYCGFSMNLLFYFSMVQFWMHVILIYYLWHVILFEVLLLVYVAYNNLSIIIFVVCILICSYDFKTLLRFIVLCIILFQSFAPTLNLNFFCQTTMFVSVAFIVSLLYFLSMDANVCWKWLSL